MRARSGLAIFLAGAVSLKKGLYAPYTTVLKRKKSPKNVFNDAMPNYWFFYSLSKKRTI